MRSFDPRRVGSLECRAWETYYRRKWGAFLVASVGLVRSAFRMSWPRTLVGAWLVLRANMVWAPFPDNDPDKARALMRRFYQLLRQSEPARFDPTRASQLEVEWWRVHREHQHAGDSPDGLIGALQDCTPTPTAPTRPRCARPLACAPRRWTSQTAGSRRAAIPPTRCWRRSGPCWCAPTRRCWPRFTGSAVPPKAAACRGS